jgi:hypothetical protein
MERRRRKITRARCITTPDDTRLPVKYRKKTGARWYSFGLNSPLTRNYRLNAWHPKRFFLRRAHFRKYAETVEHRPPLDNPFRTKYVLMGNMSREMERDRIRCSSRGEIAGVVDSQSSTAFRSNSSIGISQPRGLGDQLMKPQAALKARPHHKRCWCWVWE